MIDHWSLDLHKEVDLPDRLRRWFKIMRWRGPQQTEFDVISATLFNQPEYRSPLLVKSPREPSGPSFETDNDYHGPYLVAGMASEDFRLADVTEVQEALDEWISRAPSVIGGTANELQEEIARMLIAPEGLYALDPRMGVRLVEWAWVYQPFTELLSIREQGSVISLAVFGVD